MLWKIEQGNIHKLSQSPDECDSSVIILKIGFYIRHIRHICGISFENIIATLQLYKIKVPRDSEINRKYGFNVTKKEHKTQNLKTTLKNGQVKNDYFNAIRNVRKPARSI